MAWEDLTIPKSEGGLGIKKLEDWKKAGLAKHLWKICLHNPTSNWATWARANLLRGRSIWDIKVPTNCSWTWRKLLKIRSLFRPHIRYMVGNGQLTWLWFDFWLPMGPIHPTMGDRVIYDSGLQRHAKVATIIRNGEWRWPLANSNELLTLKEAIPQEMIPHMDMEDSIIWALTPSGNFTTKSAWEAVRRSHPPAIWSKLLWFHGNIPRAAFILWLAIRGRLSTHDRSHIPQVDPGRCLLCDAAPESHHHLFFECPMSMQIWHSILQKGHLSVPHLPWEALIGWLSSNWNGAVLSSRILKLCLAVTVSSIWQERNTRLHENSHQNVASIMHMILETVRMCLSTYRRVENNEINRNHQQDWALPDSIYA